MTVLVIGSLLVLGSAATRTTGQAMVTEESSVQGSQLPFMKQPTVCDRRRAGLRRGVVARRAATWHWQSLLEVPLTRSSHRARTAKSCPYLHWIKRLWATRADGAYRDWVDLRDPRNAICHVFGVYCSEALSVSWCESHHTTTAENGQYLGLFQMGSSERARYGHGSSALEQARAAYRYFVASGRDWSPWQCLPGGGLRW